MTRKQPQKCVFLGELANGFVALLGGHHYCFIGYHRVSVMSAFF